MWLFEARDIDKLQFIKGVQLINMKEFAKWTVVESNTICKF